MDGNTSSMPFYQAILIVDFWLIWSSFFVGVGPGVVVLHNLSKFMHRVVLWMLAYCKARSTLVTILVLGVGNKFDFLVNLTFLLIFISSFFVAIFGAFFVFYLGVEKNTETPKYRNIALIVSKKY